MDRDTSPPQDSSVSFARIVERLRRNDPDAAREIWQQFAPDMLRAARGRLRNAPPLPADEEDVAQSAFRSFWRGVAAGRFPDLDSRDDVRRSLATLVARKVVDQIARESREKRGGGRVILDEAALGGDSWGTAGLDLFVEPEPGPEETALIAEGVGRLFDLLDDEPMRVVALLKLEGYTNAEIARKLDCSLRSIERKLDLIRHIWRRELGPR